MRSISFHPAWTIRRDDNTEVAIELQQALPLACAAVMLIVHFSGATTVTAMLLVAAWGIVAASGVWAWQMARHVYARRWLQARWVQVGDVMEEQFTLINNSGLPVLWAEMADHSDVPGYNASTVRAAPGNTQVHWTYSGAATRRGEFHLGPWSVETGDPLGIFAVRVHYRQSRPLLVYPPIATLPFPPLPRGASPGPFRINQTSAAPTVNAGQVRPYAPGDPFRHIHWPSTAHRDELAVKMFDQEASANAWLMVDTDPAVQSGQGDSSTEEVSVLVAASLAADLLRDGRAVGLITHTPERRIIWPARGTGHLWTILGELARLPDAHNRSMHPQTPGLPLAHTLSQLARTLRAGSSMFIVTPSGDPAWLYSLARLAWRQITPAVILIDPAPQGRPTLEQLAMQLAEQGVASRTVRCDIPLMVRPALGKTRHWEFKTLATGRVVMTMENVR